MVVRHGTLQAPSIGALMDVPGLRFRPSTAADAARLAEVDAASWPQGMSSTAEQFAARIAALPDLQWLAEIRNTLVATVSAQRVTQRFLDETPKRFDALTDHGTFTASHDPEGDVFQLVGVGVAPIARGLQLGRKLVDHEIEVARSLPGIKRIVGFTRPARYHRHRDVPIEEYVHKLDDRGRLVDPVLAFHLQAGANLVAIYPDFRPEDVHACGYGVLIEYPV